MVLCSTTWEVKGIRQIGLPEKTWWDCVTNDMESLGLSKRMRSSEINGEGELKEQLANTGSPGKMAVKQSMCALSILLIASIGTLTKH